MSFDKSTFDTTVYDDNYPRTQTDKQRIDSNKMVPIPSALVQIVNSEEYRLGLHVFRNWKLMISNKNGTMRVETLLIEQNENIFMTIFEMN